MIRLSPLGFLLACLLFVILNSPADALTCSVCGHRDCCASDACSIECRTVHHKGGGVCRFSAQEDRCICYCYSETDEGKEIIREELLRAATSDNSTLDSVIHTETPPFTTQVTAKEQPGPHDTPLVLLASHTAFGQRNNNSKSEQQVDPKNDCIYGAAKYCMTWEQCVQGCDQYYPSRMGTCLLGWPGRNTGCCVCDVNCNSHCEWGWCPCAMGCGCR
jgi:hypothetical protein